jgi:hypothetical protein
MAATSEHMAALTAIFILCVGSLGTWNVRIMYKADSLRVVAEEISKYRSDLMGVQEVRWDRGGTEPASQLYCSMGRGIRIMN